MNPGLGWQRRAGRLGDRQTLLLIIALVALTVAGAVVRWYGLRTNGLWIDEIGEAVTAALAWPEMLATVRSQAGAAPLDFVGVKVMTALFGDGTTSARLWAFTMGVTSIPLAYLAGRQLSGSRLAGVAAAFLVASSPLLVLYSREARFYSQAVAVTLLIVITHEYARSRPMRWGRWVVHGVAAAGGVLTHYYVGFIPIALALGAITAWARSPHRRLPSAIGRGELIALGVAVPLTLPWFAYALPYQFGRSFHWDVPSFSLESWLATTTALVSPGEADAAPALVTLMVCAAAALVLRASLSVAALSVFALVFIPLVWTLAARSSYQVSVRQAILALPVVYLVAAYGLARLVGVVRDTGLRHTAAVLTAAMAVAWLLMMWSPLSSAIGKSGVASEDFPGASRFISTAMCEDATVYTNLGAAYRFGIGYYEPELQQVAVRVEHSGEAIQDALQRLRPAREDIVVVLAHTGGLDSPNVRGRGAMRAWFKDAGWSERTFGEQLLVYFRDTCAAK